MRVKSLIALIVCTLVASIAAAQQPEFPTPQKEHEWLQQFVGKWDLTAEGFAGPDQPKIVCHGTMDARMLGGFWMISENSTEMMGVKISAIQTIGYSPEKKKYVGTWVDSMMNHMWKYEGTVDESGKILTLEAEGPDMSQPGKTALYRDIYEFKSKDEILSTSQMQDQSGNWVTFMTGTAKRTE